MLVISRKAGESFLIGEDIEIVITEIGADKIRIGIEAPAHIKILRKELLETIEENKAAAKATLTPKNLKYLLK